MSAIDWLIVLGLNSAIIGYGLHRARGTTTSREWFLGSRSLPWWIVGLSMFATNVDSSDFVSITGTTTSEGLHIMSVHTIGSIAGGLLAAFLVVPVIYRAGLYTNAEYLERRFGPSTRVLSALIQIQYRTSVLGMMIWSLYLMLVGVADLAPWLAWSLIVALVALSAMYTALGGLRTVVITDALQGIIIVVGGLVVLSAVWRATGGWGAMLAGLEAAGESARGLAPGLSASDLPRVSSFRGRGGGTSPIVIMLAWTIIASSYWTVNHTQTMRLMGTRSIWDMKMAAVLGVALSLPVLLANEMLGLFGRAQFPAFAGTDAMYPHLVSTYLGIGLKGLVVAGILSAGVSTFDSMGSALSALFTRDIYARFVAPDREDRHYVSASRWATIAILLLGFAYLPFITSAPTMLTAFRSVISVFVTPLFVLYLAGTLTRAHARSGLTGLISGGAYGVLAFANRELVDFAWLPEWFTGQWEAFLWSILLTAAGMWIATLRHGRAAATEELTETETGWLIRSSEALGDVREHPFDGAVPKALHPWWYAGAVVAVCVAITVWFW
ncbi:MAG: hypothetical protein MJB57_09290 [Gemmatimonadetes bacterium]|nr:hypothetical protein [Gemmatimonadota bacterium]